jgi:hypothetical protein
LQKIPALIFRSKCKGRKARKKQFKGEDLIMGKKKASMARQNRTFRLSESELQKLAKRAKAAGMSESEYVRHLILHGGVDADYIRDRQNIIKQISGVATNVNQAAKWANENKYIPQSRIDQMCIQLGTILNLLKELIQLWR